jgi:dihydropteroate synthase
MARTVACTREMRRGRLRKAGGFLEAANLLADQSPAEAESADAFVTLCIHAGIAASDVICCARLGEHAQGDNHTEAVTLLRKADSESARHLQVLLGMKTKVGYSHTGATEAEVKRAGRAAEALLEAARRANAG